MADVTASFATFATSGFLGTDWTDPGNAAASDNARAVSSGSGTFALECTNGDFTDIPEGATIVGLEVLVECHESGTSGVFSSVRMMQAGVAAGNNFAGGAAFPDATDAVVTIGSASNLQGVAWTRDDIIDPGFGVSIICGSATAEYRIDHVQVRVTYTEAGAGGPPSIHNPNARLYRTALPYL